MKGVILLCLATFALAQEPLILKIDDSPQRNFEIVNPSTEYLLPFSLNQGQRFEYFSRNIRDGSYQFGYDTGEDANGNMQHHQSRRPDGTVLGRYSYRDGTGMDHVVNYIVDKGGYRLLMPGDTIALEPVPQEIVETEAGPERARYGIGSPEAESAKPGFPSLPYGAHHIPRGPTSFGYILPY